MAHGSQSSQKVVCTQRVLPEVGEKEKKSCEQQLDDGHGDQLMVGSTACCASSVKVEEAWQRQSGHWPLTDSLNIS